MGGTRCPLSEGFHSSWRSTRCLFPFSAVTAFHDMTLHKCCARYPYPWEISVNFQMRSSFSFLWNVKWFPSSFQYKTCVMLNPFWTKKGSFIWEFLPVPASSESSYAIIWNQDWKGFFFFSFLRKAFMYRLWRPLIPALRSYSHTSFSQKNTLTNYLYLNVLKPVVVSLDVSP